MKTLSILIPTVVGREHFLEKLRSVLNPQLTEEVEVIEQKDDKEISIGKKRQELLEKATGEYVAFIDDDDMISQDYIESILKALESKPDCVSLKGVITINGKNPKVFEHSLKYTAYRTTNNHITYERFPNHLNTIKRSIAILVKFKDIRYSEDTDWATRLYNTGLLKKESYIDKILYNYNYFSRK